MEACCPKRPCSSLRPVTSIKQQQPNSSSTKCVELYHQGKERARKLLELRFHDLRCRKEATYVRYYGDGTGRDSYVVQDFGGLVYNYGAENKSVGNFYKTLRSGSMA